MKHLGIVNLIAASVFVSATLASASANEPVGDQTAMDSWQHTISTEISADASNTLKDLLNNIEIDRTASLDTEFLALQRRLAEDRVRCLVECLAAESESMREETDETFQNLYIPESQADTQVLGGSLTAGVVQ